MLTFSDVTLLLKQVLVFADSLMPTVSQALIDELPQVRQAAAQAFVHLQTHLGNRAVEEIIPQLLGELENEEHSESALDALQQIMEHKSRVVLPYLVPEIILTKIFNTCGFKLQMAGEAFVIIELTVHQIN